MVPLNGYFGRRTNPRHFRQLIAGYLVPAPGIFFGSHLKGLVLLIFFGDTAIVHGPLTGSNLPLSLQPDLAAIAFCI